MTRTRMGGFHPQVAFLNNPRMQLQQKGITYVQYCHMESTYYDVLC